MADEELDNETEDEEDNTLGKLIGAVYKDAGWQLAADSALAKQCLDAIVASMTAAGITSITVEYHGEGDEGNIDKPVLEPEDIEDPDDLLALVDTWIAALLGGGWDDGDGCSGTVVIDPAATPRASFDHRVYFTDSNDESFSVA